MIKKEIYRIKSKSGKTLFRTLDFKMAIIFCQEYKPRKNITLWCNDTLIKVIEPE